MSIREKAEAATIAKPLDEWIEDDGDVVWWCWRDGEWLGEPAYIGTPLDLGQTIEVELRTNQGEFIHQHNVGGWPGYHTHWTPHPTRPTAPGSALLPNVETRASVIEECAKVADQFTCGACGMDGKASAAIRALATQPNKEA